jgi:hypothetical protein
MHAPGCHVPLGDTLQDVISLPQTVHLLSSKHAEESQYYDRKFYHRVWWQFHWHVLLA